MGQPALPYTAAMELSENQKKHLRRLGHALKPVVMLGQHGLTEAVTREMDLALAHHELIKVTARVGEREDRDTALQMLADSTKSTLVKRIGNVGLFFRPKPKLSRIVLPST
jgi:RNA-binding protein